MREKVIEQALVAAVKRHQGIAPKLVCPGYNGMPDRMILMPHGRIGFVEVKAPGKAPRPLQAARHQMLRSLSFPVFVLDDFAAIPPIIERIAGGRTAAHTDRYSSAAHSASPFSGGDGK